MQSDHIQRDDEGSAMRRPGRSMIQRGRQRPYAPNLRPRVPAGVIPGLSVGRREGRS